MIMVSDPASGAISLVFKNEEDLEFHIKKLQELAEYKKTFELNRWPATYTIACDKAQGERQIQDHVTGSKRVFFE